MTTEEREKYEKQWTDAGYSKEVRHGTVVFVGPPVRLDEERKEAKSTTPPKNQFC
jgi:hypothetical protein